LADFSESGSTRFERDASVAIAEKQDRLIREWSRALRIGFRVYLIDLRARNRRHWLGLLWVVAPLLLALAIGFGIQAARWPQHFAAMAIPYPLYVLTGLVLWQSFAESVLMPLRQLVAFRAELARGVMTVEQAIVVGLFDLSFTVGLRGAFVLASVLVFGASHSPSLVFAPLLLFGLVGIGLALGMVLGLPGLLVDDIGRALGLALAVGTLSCPIFYPVADIDYLSWNPLAALIDGARASLTGQLVSPLVAVGGLLVAAALLCCAAGWLRLARRHFLNVIA
jgi:lipopolysaccharide transport system permease protein